MVLDSKIAAVQNHFGIAEPGDWGAVEPKWILGIDGVGPVTLSHIRMYLAARDLTLKNDRTAQYWKENLSAARICQTMGNESLADGPVDSAIINPFTVLIDSAEQQPFSFKGLETDADLGGRPLIVPIEWRCLGRHPDSLGDYSIEGFQGRIHVERKSLDDAHGTILGWGGRRERFEKELENLNSIYRSYVIVEASFGQLISSAPEWGKRSATDNRKAIFRSILAWQHRFPLVHWEFCDDRRLAEVTCFRILERFWKDETL